MSSFTSVVMQAVKIHTLEGQLVPNVHQDSNVTMGYVQVQVDVKLAFAYKLANVLMFFLEKYRIQIFNYMRTTRFLNTFHRRYDEDQKIGKTHNSKYLGARKSMSLIRQPKYIRHNSQQSIIDMMLEIIK